MTKTKRQKAGKPKRSRRNIFRSLVIAGASLMPGLGMAAPKSPLPHVATALRSAKPSLRIVALGSSSTKGYGASSEAAAYPAQLEGLLVKHFAGSLPVHVDNQGVGGEDIDDMMKRLSAVVADRPDLVIWQIGSNDPIRGVPLERFDEEARQGVAILRAAGIDVMLMEPQWCPTLDKIAGSDRFLHDVRKVGEDLGVPVIRRSDMMHEWVEKKLLDREKMLSADGLHMTDASYALLAEAVAETIVSTIDQPATAPALAQADKTVR